MSFSRIGLIFIIAVSLLGMMLSYFALQVKYNTQQAHSAWDGFEVLNSEKAQALISLRKELGYGGAIHNFKNYLLRQNPTYLKSAKIHISASIIALEEFSTMVDGSGVETTAVESIRATIQNYQQAFQKAEQLVAGGLSVSEIEKLVEVDDTLAISALNELSKRALPVKETNSPLTRVLLVDSLREYMGYGGMIHNFKNYIIRGGSEYEEKVQKDILEAKLLIEEYKSAYSSQKEVTALVKIEGILNEYSDMLLIAIEMRQQGFTPEEIDEKVQVDDQPAFDGLALIYSEIIKAANEEAKKVVNSLDNILGITTQQLWIVIVSSLTMVFSSIYIIRFRFITPLNKLSTTMEKLAAGNVKSRVTGITRQDEIGAMARSVDIFRRIAVARKKAENELLLSEARYSEILEHAPEAIIAVDREQNIKVFNHGAEIVFGYSASEAIGQPLDILLPENIKSFHKDLVLGFEKSEVASKPMAERSEITGVRKGGAAFPAQGTITTMTLGGESLFTIILQDLSVRREAELRVVKAVREAELANRSKSQFLANMSHDLRTPLNAILGFSNMMKEETLGKIENEKYLEYAEDIYSSGSHLLEIINNILDLSKIESGESKLILEEVEPEVLIRETINFVEFKARQVGISIELINNASKAKLSADKSCFKQIMANLLSNAVKFTPANGKVKVAITKIKTGELEIAVEDTGIGIDEKDIATAFEAFKQIDSGLTRNLEGSGLGLSLVKSLVELHNGRVRIESKVDIGTKVIVTFPKEGVIT